jgi:hypothetical protein
MRKAILASVILGSMFSAVQAADVGVNGNFGYRNDSFEVGSAHSNKDRLRVQVDLTATVNDKTTVVVGVTTGDNSKTGWTDIGGLNSYKNIGLNVAYVEYAAAPFAKVTLGKMDRPWESSALFFDNDVVPEGASVALKSDSSGIWATGFKLKLSDEASGKDSDLVGAQVGIRKNIAGADIVAHAGMMNQEIVSSGICIVPLSVPSLPVCQSVAKNNLTLFGVNASKVVAGIPVTVFAEQAKNDKAARNNEATAYGVTFGKANAPGKWEVAYIHQKVEQNSISTVWTDSDFANGLTAHSGYGVRGTYAIATGWKVNVRYYDTEVGVTTKTPIKRTISDLVYSF